MIQAVVIIVLIALLCVQLKSQGSSEELSVNVTFSAEENCTIFVQCLSNLASNDCVLEISEDASYENIKSSIEVPQDTYILIPDIAINEVFYYQITILYNSTVRIQQRRNFTVRYNRERPSPLTVANQVLLALGVIFVGLSLALGIVWQRVEQDLMRKPWFSLTLLAIGIFMTVVSILLWLAVAFQVGLQYDMCDLSWSRLRDILIITAHFFADLGFLIVFASLLSRCFNFDKHVYHALANYYLGDLYRQFRDSRKKKMQLPWPVSGIEENQTVSSS